MSRRNGQRRTAQMPRREPDAVVAAFVHSTKVSYSWHRSMVMLLAKDITHNARIARGGMVDIRMGTDGLVDARNRAVRDFLDGEEFKNVPWFWWSDTDMGFSADALEQLISVADPKERPIVGGLCFQQKEPEMDGMGGFQTEAAPTIYIWGNVNGIVGFHCWYHYPANSVLQCDATGSAFLLIHRTVLERMREEGDVWYDRITGPDNGMVLSEDLSFCTRAMLLGIPIHIHTGVRTTHHKEVWVGEPRYWMEQAMRPTGAAVPETAVIVPSYRVESAEPFMEGLRKTTGNANVYAVIRAGEEGDAVATAWRAAGAVVLRSEGEGWARKCNHGYRETAEDWLFFVGDDVRFWPGWLEQAHHTADVQRAQVVGTNDLGNPRTMRGELATHWLSSRAYIAEMGSSWDGPGIVCHEGYEAWFNDDEVVTVARQRGVYAHALGSHVEHMHPLWGKGGDNVNPALPEDAIKRDKALFLRRLKENQRPALKVAEPVA